MTAFHTDEYIDFLSRVSPDNMENYVKEQSKCNVLSPLSVLEKSDDSVLFVSQQIEHQGIVQYLFLTCLFLLDHI